VVMVIQNTLSKEDLANVKVVVLHVDVEWGQSNIEDFAQRAGFPEDCVYILLTGNESMEFLDEDQMAEHGWVRTTNFLNSRG